MQKRDKQGNSRGVRKEAKANERTGRKTKRWKMSKTERERNSTKNRLIAN